MRKNRDVSYRRQYRPGEEKVKRMKRNKAMLVVLVVLLALLLGVSQWDSMKEHYLLISVIVLILGLSPVLVSFEQRKPQAREIVMLSVLTALCVAVNVLCSHTIPLHAGTMLVILTGIALGPEAGFLVGALARLLCNFFDGQGPWTPWQMLTWGLLGLLAGFVFYRMGEVSRYARSTQQTEAEQPLKKSYKDSIWCMTAFTFGSVVFLYGGIMNLAAWLMSHALNPADTPLTGKALLAVYVTGIPYDISHGLGAAVCMFLFGEPLLTKIRRVQIKFGIYIGERRM
ncbi:MAG: ECF transporter S component [Lachnospiraceae bacterium]|nr:ECF transporter S component [Lachnospiraceae bacterium]